ncbi:MAG TPA: DUF2007 domain-containing protein [Verrucomicrobiae bacterium]|nr:DUF2007 domain-containing protein [Verrucomicrobiae bacterium]
MKLVFTSPRSELVGLMQGILESAKIPCEIRNNVVSQALVGLQFSPELWVLRDKDYDEAMALISEFNQKTTDNLPEPEETVPPNIAFKKFRTNIHLWLVISLILFIPPWFVLNIYAGASDDIRHPIQLWFSLFHNPANVKFSRIFFFSCFIGVPALVVGWIIQCLVILIQDAVAKIKRHSKK